MSESVNLSMEKAHLKDIVFELNREIRYIDDRVAEITHNFQEAKKDLWQNIYDIDPHEVQRTRQLMGEEMDNAEIVLEQQRKLKKLLDSPYFARIDFDSENFKEEVYIGIFSLFNEDKTDMLIYDWRAPISSMYYDFELGKCNYETPDGYVSGEMLLKRQYKIKNSEMEYMLESSINIGDDILQKELSSTSDEKMKNIVATIQKEQNAIIRNEEADVLIIQGVAGSGKTSIALHRVAYFLYKYKNSLNAKNILIISPNKVFADYISNVLPELGEEPIAEISIDEIAENELDEKIFQYETFADQVTYLLENQDQGYIDRIKYKSSYEFVESLNDYIEYYKSAYFEAEDIILPPENKILEDEYFVPKEFVKSRYFVYKRYPVMKRIEETADDIYEKLQADMGKTLKKLTLNRIRKKVRNMFKFNKLMDIYSDFYAYIGKPELFQMKKGKILEYSDVFALIYLKLSFEGTRDFLFVKHLLVDEMQDYTPVQLAVLNELFKCRKTILGDYSQAVNPHISQPSAIYAKIYDNMEYVQMFKSYRSTIEIIDFAKRFNPNLKIEAVERHGDKPEIIECKDSESEIEKLRELISDFEKSKYNSMGIICRTQDRAKAVYEALKVFKEDINYLDFESDKFTEGITVTTVHMSKGLEFDQVILPQVNAEVYYRPGDDNLLYIGCTRAMHSLKLLYHGKKTNFI